MVLRDIEILCNAICVGHGAVWLVEVKTEYDLFSFARDELLSKCICRGVFYSIFCPARLESNDKLSE